MFWLGLVIGMWTGATLGVAILAIVTMAKDEAPNDASSSASAASSQYQPR